MGTAPSGRHAAPERTISPPTRRRRRVGPWVAGVVFALAGVLFLAGLVALVVPRVTRSPQLPAAEDMGSSVVASSSTAGLGSAPRSQQGTATAQPGTPTGPPPIPVAPTGAPAQDRTTPARRRPSCRWAADRRAPASTGSFR
jgi:hypothetical protein